MENRVAQQQQHPEIPIIRLDNDNATSSQQEHAMIVQQIREACLKTGFFYVTGHGIDVSNVLQQSKIFFDLPVTEKVQVADPTLARGYTAMQEETLDPKHQTVGDTKEGFYISINDIPIDDTVRYNPAKLAGPNQWPDTIKCPSMKDPTMFKSTMIQYMKDITVVAVAIVRLLAESLDLSPNYFDHAVVDNDPMATLRLLHYSNIKSNIENGIYACGAHTDYGMITLLLTDENNGLQIYDQRGCQQWINVPTRPDCFIVNLGDMLERWTNGKYCSTLHRVINITGHERYSIPFFFEPAFDTVVECLPNCCSLPENPPKYPPTTSGEHLLAKYKETHADFTPIDE